MADLQPTPVVLSAAVGPAKWVAVIILSAACGGGLVWSLTSREPRHDIGVPVAVEHLTAPVEAPSPQPPPVVIPQPPVTGVPAPQSAAPQAPPTQSAPVVIPVSPVTPLSPADVPKAPVQPPSQQPAPPQPVAPSTTPSAPAPPAEPIPSSSLVRKININTASVTELELLPQIGPALAGRIVDYRTAHGPFKSITELDKVSGIGPKTMAKLAPLVTVE